MRDAKTICRLLPFNRLQVAFSVIMHFSSVSKTVRRVSLGSLITGIVKGFSERATQIARGYFMMHFIIRRNALCCDHYFNKVRALLGESGMLAEKVIEHVNGDKCHPGHNCSSRTPGRCEIRLHS
jgi:hypothetical protein